MTEKTVREMTIEELEAEGLALDASIKALRAEALADTLVAAVPGGATSERSRDAVKQRLLAAQQARHEAYLASLG